MIQEQDFHKSNHMGILTAWPGSFIARLMDYPLERRDNLDDLKTNMVMY